MLGAPVNVILYRGSHSCRVAGLATNDMTAAQCTLPSRVFHGAFWPCIVPGLAARWGNGALPSRDGRKLGPPGLSLPEKESIRGVQEDLRFWLCIQR
jgi:hypothetical protein